MTITNLTYFLLTAFILSAIGMFVGEGRGKNKWHRLSTFAFITFAIPLFSILIIAMINKIFFTT